jgi:hypothetical protein
MVKKKALLKGFPVFMGKTGTIRRESTTSPKKDEVVVLIRYCSRGIKPLRANNPAAYNNIPVVQHRRLPRADCPLGAFKLDVQAVFPGLLHDCGLFRLEVAGFYLYPQGLRQSAAGYQVDVVRIQALRYRLFSGPRVTVLSSGDFAAT